MSGSHMAPEGNACVIDVPIQEAIPITEIGVSGKRGIPVLIAPFLSDGPSGTLAPTLHSAFKGLLVINEEDENDSKLQRKKWFKEMRGWLMVLATLAASVTYQAGLNPPGGFWQDDNGHVAGNPVMHDRILKRYETFYYFNATAFVTSLVIIILLMNENFYHKEGKVVTLWITTILDLISLMGAYVSGSARDVSSSIYLIVLTVVVFIYVINIARALPNMCFVVLYLVPHLEKLVPAMEKTKARVAEARAANKAKSSTSTNTRCASCCPLRKEQPHADLESS